MRIKAYAKINLTLDVFGLREDGYHEIHSVMQQIDLCDIIDVIEEEREIQVLCDKKELPSGKENIAYKAAKAFYDKTGKGFCKITIEKKIPHQAGLGGGSADAAAVIIALNELYKTALTEEELEEIGKQVGSDVPFCIRGGCALATGRGEKLLSLNNMPECEIVIVKPENNVSTKEAYAAIDRLNFERINRSEKMRKALECGREESVWGNIGNDFEYAVNAEETNKIKNSMMKAGALACAMSGSGSAVYGIFKNKKGRELADMYENVFITKPVYLNK